MVTYRSLRRPTNFILFPLAFALGFIFAPVFFSPSFPSDFCFAVIFVFLFHELLHILPWRLLGLRVHMRPVSAWFEGDAPAWKWFIGAISPVIFTVILPLIMGWKVAGFVGTVASIGDIARVLLFLFYPPLWRKRIVEAPGGYDWGYSSSEHQPYRGISYFWHQVLLLPFLLAGWVAGILTTPLTPTLTPTPTPVVLRSNEVSELCSVRRCPTSTPTPAFLGSNEATEVCSLRNCPTPIPTSTPTPTPTSTLTPTPAPTSTPKPTPTPVPIICPSGMECGTFFYEPLKKEARYYRGWRYEFIDASDRFELVLVRDVYGYFIDKYWGEKFSFIRWTIMDRYIPPDCSPSGTLANIISYAPVALTDIYSSCGNRSLTVYGGDGAGAMIGVGCDLFNRAEKECFIAIISPGPYLTDCIIGYLAVAPEHKYIWEHPVFDTDERFKLLGNPRREGDQWRWDDPFLLVVPAK